MVRYPVRMGELPNGMMLYAQPGEKVNLSAIGVRAGSVHTPKGKASLPHLVEHLQARHSCRHTVDEINLALLELTGGPDSHNIRIDHTSTLYGHDKLATKHQVRRLFNLFAELLEDRVIDADSIAAEKSTVHQEYWLRGKDVAEVEVWDMLRSLMFCNHPAGIRTDAEIPDLKSIEPKDISRFIKRYYVASNMFVVMLGPSFKEVCEVVSNTFGHWPALQPPKNGLKRFARFRPLRSNLSTEKQQRGIHQTHMAVGFRTEGFSSEDGLALDVLAEIWRYRLSARLREQNRHFNTGTYRVYTLSERTFVHGLFGAQFASTSAKYADYGREFILQEAGRLAQQLPDAAIFHAAKNSLHNQFRINWGDVPLWTCEQVTLATSNGDPDLVSLHQYQQRLRLVTRHDIRRVAQKYFKHSHGIAVIHN